MAWATEDDVVALTGQAVTTDELAMAQALIEGAIGRTEAMATAEMVASDLEWLRRATSYQAVWMAGQPDLFTRMNVKQLSQDGLSATMNEDALLLAPLAKRELKRLSWRRGTRSLDVEPFCPTKRLRWPVGGPVVDYENEPWQPLGRSPWGRY
jgi:hypothetical protein